MNQNTLTTRGRLRVRQWATRIYKKDDFEFTKLARMVAHNVADLRSRRWLTQRELSEKSKINRTTISYIEGGLGNPGIYHLFKLAQFFEIPLSRLLATPFSYTKKSPGESENENIFQDLPPGWQSKKKILAPTEAFTLPLERFAKGWIYTSRGQVHLHGPTYSESLRAGECLKIHVEGEHRVINAQEHTPAAILILTCKEI
jgi:transcriptional regulator with XRE-family HTH domain